MRRFFFATMIVVAFSLAIAVTAGADPMTTATSPGTDQASGHAAWVGKTTVDLLVNLGVPTYTDKRAEGETLVYVKYMPVGSNSSAEVVRRFTVDTSGKITSEVDSQS